MRKFRATSFEQQTHELETLAVCSQHPDAQARVVDSLLQRAHVTPMPSPVLLEVCVETVASAIAAQRGGARRIELCSNLAVEGVTPNPTLIEQVRRQVAIPLHVLIRPRAGDFHYTATEFEAIKSEIHQAKNLGANGLVFGVLDSSSRIDVARTCELVKLARPLSVTFHRAFDACPDLPAALNDVVRTGADRVLTSGGARTANQGVAMLARLVKSAAGRIEDPGLRPDPRREYSQNPRLHWRARSPYQLAASLTRSEMR